VNDTSIEELEGKIISSAKAICYSKEEQTLSLEFTDGTSFSYSCSTRVASEISLYRGGTGEPEVIRAVQLGT